MDSRPLVGVTGCGRVWSVNEGGSEIMNSQLPKICSGCGGPSNCGVYQSLTFAFVFLQEALRPPPPPWGMLTPVLSARSSKQRERGPMLSVGWCGGVDMMYNG